MGAKMPHLNGLLLELFGKTKKPCALRNLLLQLFIPCIILLAKTQRLAGGPVACHYSQGVFLHFC